MLLNDNEIALPKPKAHELRLNLQGSIVSFTTHEDREIMVAPCVALVPGVLNGELVTLDAISTSCRQWNGRPVVVDHPRDNTGEAISAANPLVIANVGVGQIWHAHLEGNRLKCQVWIDVNKAIALGGDARKAFDMIKNGESLEVSTGYWAVSREKRGTHNGIEYNAIQEMIMPDHLALLPNAIGACNWADGCGMPRMNKDNRVEDEKTILQSIMTGIKKLLNNTTATDKMEALHALVNNEMQENGVYPHMWHLADIEDNYVVIGKGTSFQKRPFDTLENGSVALSGEWETVRQQTSFVPMTTNCSCGQDKDEETTAEVAEKDAPEKDDDDKGTEDKPETEDDDMPDEVTTNQVDTLQVFLTANSVTESDVVQALETRKTLRQELANTIKANTSLTDNDLSPMADSVLRALADVCKLTGTSSPITGNEQGALYAGRGMPDRGALAANSGVPERPARNIRQIG